jgi:hypothetical protein
MLLLLLLLLARLNRNNNMATMPGSQSPRRNELGFP